MVEQAVGRVGVVMRKLMFEVRCSPQVVGENMTHQCRRAQTCRRRYAIYRDANPYRHSSSKSKMPVATNIICLGLWRASCLFAKGRAHTEYNKFECDNLECDGKYHTQTSSRAIDIVDVYDPITLITESGVMIGKQAQVRLVATSPIVS
jgi:hypothetical protein